MKPKVKTAAVLTIYGAADMTPAGRKRIAKWIDRQKQFFLKYPKVLANRHTARYLYDEATREK